MNQKEMFYEKIRKEYEAHIEEIEQYSPEEFMERAAKISDMKDIYEYLMRDRPLRYEDEIDYFARIPTPLEFIAKCYENDKPPIYDTLNRTLHQIQDKDLAEVENISDAVLELTRRCEAIAADDEVLFVNDLKYNTREVGKYQAKVLLQFDNPVRVAYDFSPPHHAGNFKTKIEAIINRIMQTDIFTQPYELRMDKILPESIQKHEAISEILEMLPQYDFATTMKWLNFFEEVHCVRDGILEGENPYARFVDAVDNVKSKYGDEMLQKLYDLAKKDQCILESEFEEAAAYLFSGGDISDVYNLATQGIFLELGMKKDEQEQGGMDLC